MGSRRASARFIESDDISAARLPDASVVDARFGLAGTGLICRPWKSSQAGHMHACKSSDRHSSAEDNGSRHSA